MMNRFSKMRIIVILAIVLLKLAVFPGMSQSAGDAGSLPGADTAKVNALLQQTREF